MYSKEDDGAHARIRTGDLFLTKWSSVPGEFELILRVPFDVSQGHLTKTCQRTAAVDINRQISSEPKLNDGQLGIPSGVPTIDMNVPAASVRKIEADPDLGGG